jgi:hypothetical protein
VKKNSVFLGLIVLLYGCNFQPQERTLITSSGIQYEIVDFGDETSPMGIGHSVYLNQNISIGDSVEFLPSDLNHQLHLMGYLCKEGTLELFEKLYSGDSVHAQITLHQLLMCGIIKEIPKNCSANNKANWRFRISKLPQIDVIETEMPNLKEAIITSWKEEGDSLLPYYDMLIAFRDSCKGEGLESGNKVKIVHKTMRLDGSIIEYSTFKEPFEFILGQQGQVIEGMQIAISYLCRGQRARVLIPAVYSFSQDFRNQAEIYNDAIIAEIEVLK